MALPGDCARSAALAELRACDVPEVEDDGAEPADGPIDTDESYAAFARYAKKIGLKL